MALEKFINGKHDDAHHDGKAANTRRLMESDDVLTTLWPELRDAAIDGSLESEDEFHPIDNELAES